MQIRERFDCQFMNVADFHPFVGFYSGIGTVGIAWEPRLTRPITKHHVR